MDDGSHENREGVRGESEHAAGSWVEAAVVFDHAVDAFDRVAGLRLGRRPAPWSGNGSCTRTLWPGHGDTHVSGIARLVSSKRHGVVAGKERTVELGGPPEELSARVRVAGSGRAAPSVIAALVDDPHPVVRRAVATSNVVTPADLERLVKDPDPSVRQAAASNPRTPGRALAALADDPDSAVRYTAAAHPAMPDSLRKKILRS